tara:strand:+ start:158 stop:409 length:252 start_codon:yes stop_codon:yes gene_type:complete
MTLDFPTKELRAAFVAIHSQRTAWDGYARRVVSRPPMPPLDAVQALRELGVDVNRSDTFCHVSYALSARAIEVDGQKVWRIVF